jgi:hypothetical protein
MKPEAKMKSVGLMEANSEFPDITLKSCDGLASAVNADVGAMVEKVQTMILDYYKDVRGQAMDSFKSAKQVSKLGFNFLVATVVYVMVIDLLAHFKIPGFVVPDKAMNVGTIGVISSGVIEFIAAVNFVLWGRATRQFGAFHICLERTHRYLLAYKVAEKMQSNRDQTLERIVCIMANAPMITRADIEGVESGRLLPNLRQTDGVNMVAGRPPDASAVPAVAGSIDRNN